MREFPVPGKRLLITLLIPLAFFLIGIYLPVFKSLAVLINILIVLFSVSDILLIHFNTDLDFNYQSDLILNISNTNSLDVLVNHKGNVNLYVELGVDLPDMWEQNKDNPVKIVKQGSSTKFELSVTPHRRGSYKINTLHYKVTTFIGFFHMYFKNNVNITAIVYPDFTGVKEYLKLTRSNRLYELGVHKNRYKGSGTELNSLREYNQDDDAKFIDWKASSRLNRPVTKQFQMESQNDVVLVLDCGRLMSGEENNLSSLDHAVNGILTLSHIAANMGDNIRIIAFSDKIDGDLRSVKGHDKLKKIIKFITPLQPKFVESNYELAFNYLRTTMGKRSLIIFISDIIDDINYGMFKGNFSYMARKHQILFLLLRDILLETEAFKTSKSTDDFFNLASARELYLKRSNTINKLKLTGIDILDVLPTNISGRLIDRYLSLKSRNKI